MREDEGGGGRSGRSGRRIPHLAQDPHCDFVACADNDAGRCKYSKPFSVEIGMSFCQHPP